MIHCAFDRSATTATLGPIRIAAAIALLVLASTPSGCRGGEDRMARIRALQDAGRFEESIDALRDFLAATPEHPEANYRLGVALVRTGNPSRSIWALEKASESREFAIPSNLQIAAVQFGLNNFEASIRASDRVLTTDPDQREALSLNARAHVGARQLDAALVDTRRLLELDPDDYETLVVHATVLAELGRQREAELAHERIAQLGEASGDAERAARSCLAPALFAQNDLEDVERAEALYTDCASRYPDNRTVVIHIARFFGSVGKPQRAVESIRRAVAAAPDDLALRFELAAQLTQLGLAREAEGVLEQAVDRFGVEAAGTQLARHYRRQREPQRALEVVDAIVKQAGGSDPIQLLRADLLVDVGELDRAEELATQFAEPSYASLIRGRILLARGDAGGALAAFDAGIARWPNNAGARYLAGMAALRLGDFERATSELRESVRVDDSATEAARILARLYFDRREYAQAIAFSAIAQQHADPAQRAEDLELDARAFAAAGEFERARLAIRALAALPGRAGEAAAELAAVERMKGGPAAAVASIEGLELDLRDPANEPALRAFAEDLVAIERADRAIAEVDRALRARPDSAALHALMGTTLARAYRAIDARGAFERALAIDPDQPEALGGLAALAGAAGDTRRAIEFFDRAAAVDPGNPIYSYAAAQLVLRAGDRSAAEARLRTLVRQSAAHAGARNDLAWLLTTDGRELDLALSLAREASRLRPESATLDTLGFVHIQRGENESAVDALEQAIAVSGTSPSIHYHLALALERSGETERARDLLRRALASGDFPEADAARLLLARLDPT